MMKMCSRKLGVLVLLAILVIGVALVGGYIKEKHTLFIAEAGTVAERLSA